MFRKDRQIEHARFRWENGITGTYTTPAIAGTRSAGAIASAWAVLNLLGREGYAKAVARLMRIKEELMAEIVRHPGLEILGRPEGGIFYVQSRKHDAHAIAAGLKERGWKVMIGDNPRSIGCMVNGLHQGVAKELSGDLGDVIEHVAAGRIDASDMKAVYGR
jgi:glutamate/tyrosine decarboxylase-like PLP-dependent enzyme